MTLMKQFNRAAHTYNYGAHIQSITARKVFEMNTHTSPKFTLDIGCGTGILTKKFAQAFPQSTIKAIDISENMIHQVQSLEEKNICTECTDYLTLNSQEGFDLIISNAALHWMDTKAAVQKIAKELTPKGNTLLAIFGSKTSQELYQLLPVIGRHNQVVSSTFYTSEDLIELGHNNFKHWQVNTEIITISFDSIFDLLKVQKDTGVNVKLKNDGLWTPRQLKDLEETFIGAYGQVQLTYEIHYCKGAND